MNDRYKKIDEKSKIVTDGLGCKIDNGIRELIVLLNYNNIGTTQSCWGHKNWGEKFQESAESGGELTAVPDLKKWVEGVLSGNHNL